MGSLNHVSNNSRDASLCQVYNTKLRRTYRHATADAGPNWAAFNIDESQAKSRWLRIQCVNHVFALTLTEDPTPIVNRLFPTEEAARLLQQVPDGEQLDAVESSGIARYEALLHGDYPKPGRI